MGVATRGVVAARSRYGVGAQPEVLKEWKGWRDADQHGRRSVGRSVGGAGGLTVEFPQAGGEGGLASKNGGEGAQKAEKE